MYVKRKEVNGSKIQKEKHTCHKKETKAGQRGQQHSLKERELFTDYRV
jgi:hypothetical protein